MKQTLLTMASLAITLFSQAQSPATCFNNAVNYGTGSYPNSVTSADFNSDGKADIAIANYGSDNVSILLGSGTGTFATAVNYGAGIGPSSVISGDFNGDGKVDLATANIGSDNVSILLGSGTGTFATAVNYGTSTNPISITSADFNGDGKTDLATANYITNNVSILLGSGTGTFSTAVNYGAGTNPFSVTSGDFNGDGVADLAIANNSGNNVSILLGSGTGTFAPAVYYWAGTYPRSVTSADFNGDGKADLATTNQTSNNVSILLGSGTGTFATAINYGVGSYPNSVISADFNGDGKADLATANYSSSDVSVLLGSGTGTFATAVNYALGSAPNSVISADFNSDGKVDLATANNGGNASVLLNCFTYPAGAALNFTGTDNIVTVANTGNAFDASQQTVECWFNSNSSASNMCLFSQRSSPASNTRWSLHVNNSTNSIGVWNAIGYNTINATITPNTWYHIAAVMNTTGSTIYLNGNLIGTITSGINTSNTSLPFSIGGPNDATYPNEYFNGTIDEVRFWNRALCQPEIQNNMTGEIATTANGLVANYHFNEGISSTPNPTVTTLTDFSGNNYNGILNNLALTGSASNWVAPGAVTSGSTVTAFVSPTVAISGPSVTCSGSPITLTASGNVVNYAWKAGPNTNTISVSPTVNTTYSVVGTNSLGCESNIAAQSISVIASSTITVNSATVCNGSNAVLNANVAAVSPTYCIGSTSLYGCANGYYISNVTYSSINNNSGCSYGTNYANISTPNPTIVAGTAYSLSMSTGISGEGIAAWIDFNQDGVFSASENIVSSNTSVFYTYTTSVIIPTTAINGATKMRVRCHSQSAPLPTDACSYLDYSEIEDYAITITGATNATAAVVWSPATFLNSTTAQTVTASNVTATTNYTVSTTDANGCSAAAIASVSVNALPSVTATSSNTLICVGQTSTLSATGATSYTWNTSSTNTVIAVSPTVTTVYTVTGTNANGCMNTAMVTQSVSACAGIQSNSSNLTSNISIYPNPNNGLFNLDVTTPTTISIFNALGAMVYQSTLEVGTHQINLSAYANGLYMVKANGSVLRLIKE